MKSEHNFTVVKEGVSYDMDSLGIWVNFLRIGSPKQSFKKLKVRSSPITRITSHSEEERKVQVELLVEAESMKEYETLYAKIYNLFVSPEPIILIRDSHPGESIQVINEEEYTPDDITTTDGEINFQLTMIDPYIYDSEKEIDFQSGVAVVNNKGTVTSSPIFEVDVIESVTHIDIISDDGYFRIGQPEPIDRPVYQRTSLIANYPLTSLVGWSTASAVDNGYVAGTMVATPTGFKADTFGTAITPSKWQGPAVRRSLPEPLQNFRIDLEVDLLNASAQTGMIELYLKDAGGNTVAKIGVEDIWNSLAKVQGKFQVGNVNNRVVDYRRIADTESAWNNYKGMIRLHRDGNRFRPYFALIRPDGKHVWTSQQYVYTDQKGDFLAPIVEVVIAIRKWPNTTHAQMLVKNLKVYRYNSEPEGVPIIANAGDKVVIDTNDSSIRINGEDRKSLKDFGASFFKLKKGVNAILLEPADKLSGQIRYRERYR